MKTKNVPKNGVVVLPMQKLMSEDIKCIDILRCVLNLNKLEAEVYSNLVHGGPARVEELSELMGKDRSTVYRALQKLISCRLCYRDTKTIERGGYYHVYSAIPPKAVKKEAKKCINNWYRSMKNALKKI
ncbi:MAG: helix-turn-helix domain-containing protein [Methanocellales archaeon]|nr:helix-turn-helix domain-containing protein [Methanocellales archaeon]